MSAIVERMARAICLVDGAEDDGLSLVPGDTYSDYARAALRSVRPEDVTDEMVELARLELIPMADECFMDDYREECLTVIRRALAAAIAKGAE